MQNNDIRRFLKLIISIINVLAISSFMPAGYQCYASSCRTRHAVETSAVLKNTFYDFEA